MQFPFSVSEFLNVFKAYNETVFPLQILFYLTGFTVIWMVFRQVKGGDKIISAVLSFLWLWIGIVYHILYFTTINPLAYFFGVLFILQGVLFFVYGVWANKLTFRYRQSPENYIGTIFLLYGLIIYPIFGHLLGHRYPYSPTFGLPCPTTIFTFGILLFIDRKISPALLIIPVIWSVIGFGAALNLSILEDFGLLVAGIAGFITLLIHNRQVAKAAV